jgi:large repetitive protein
LDQLNFDSSASAPQVLLRDVRVGTIASLTSPDPFSGWSPLSATTSIIAATSGPNGQITVIASGGMSPYTYSIDSAAPQASAVFPSLNSGYFSFEVTDFAGCTFSLRVLVPQQAALTASVVSRVWSNCAPAATGSLTITASGGSTPYTYYLDGMINVGTVFSNLAGGYHEISVLDNAARWYNFTELVPRPDPISLSWRLSDGYNVYTQQQLLLDVTVSGGIAPHRISLNGSMQYPPQGFASYTLTPRSYGAWDLSVSSTYSCSGSTRVYFYPKPAVSATMQPVSCLGYTDGSINVTASSGSGSFEYRIAQLSTAWSSDPIFVGLAGGLYEVQVHDIYTSVISSVSIVVEEPAQLTVSVMGRRPDAGQPNGVLFASVSGGTQPYSITVRNPDTGVTDTSPRTEWYSLPSATYSTSVLDNRGCSATASTFDLFSKVVVSSSATGVSCFNSTDGSVQLQAANGDNNFEYSLTSALLQEIDYSSLVWQTGNTFTNLKPGAYVGVAKDSASPVQYATTLVQVTQPLPLLLSYVSSGTLPGNQTAVIDLVAHGGTAPYSTYLRCCSATSHP